MLPIFVIVFLFVIGKSVFSGGIFNAQNFQEKRVAEGGPIARILR